MTTTAHSTDWHDQQWWREQSKLDGTDWVTLGAKAAAVVVRLSTLHIVRCRRRCISGLASS